MSAGRRPVALAIAVLTLLAYALLAAPAGRAHAAALDEAAGSRAAQFLANGNSPEVLGMGGATLALARDVQGASWNPAALAWLGGSQITLAHTQSDDQTAQEWLALGGRLGWAGARYGLSAIVRDEGTIAGRDANDQPTGDVQASDVALSLALARPFGERLSAGGAVHFVSQRIGDDGGVGAAFDAGAQARFGFFSLALAGRDFGGNMQWDGTRWRMPAALGVGAAFDDPASGLRFALDLTAPADYYRSVHAGVEWRWRDRFALRTGWQRALGAPGIDPMDGPSFGLGAGAGRVWVDYAYVLSPDGESSQRLGFAWRGNGAGLAAPALPTLPVASPSPFAPHSPEP